MENCGPQGTNLGDINEQAKVLTLSPNCTAVYQPMYMRIILALKTACRGLSLSQIAQDIETRQQQIHEGKIIRTAMKGLAKCLDPIMLDVPRMVDRIYSTVSDVTIARC